MLFLGLGTGLGSTMILEGVIAPLELGHLAYKQGDVREDYVGEAALGAARRQALAESRRRDDRAVHARARARVHRHRRRKRPRARRAPAALPARAQRRTRSSAASASGSTRIDPARRAAANCILQVLDVAAAPDDDVGHEGRREQPVLDDTVTADEPRCEHLAGRRRRP